MVRSRSGPRCSALFCLAALLAASSLIRAQRVAAATISLLDGNVESVPELVFTPDGTSVIAGERRFALRDVDWLATGPGIPAPPVAASPGVAVLLCDGSWLPVERIAVGGPDALAVESPLGALELTLEQCLGWGPVPWLEAARRTQDGAAAATDRLLLAKEELTGLVQGIAGGQLRFAPDFAPDQVLDVAFDEVLGLCLREPARPPQRLYLRGRLRSLAPPLAILPGPELRLAGEPDHVLQALPAGRLIVEGGRRVWLSQLAPKDVEEEGAFGVTWHHATDRNIDGTPLILDGRRYERGLVVHSQARLTWALNGAYTRFSSLVGISDTVGREGDCTVHLLVDGAEVWSQRVRGGQDPHQVAFTLAGAEQLELRVAFGKRYDIGDHVALAGAWLARE
ncbi:MAG: NPCBM/NEW2 domain-containing protein [Planctomycetota bacterium]